MRDTRPTILCLSGGSQVGQNFIQSLGPRREMLRLIASNSVAEEPSLADFDEVRLVPSTRRDEAELRARLKAWIAEAAPRLIVPCRDDDVLLLAEMAEEDPAIAAIAAVGSAHAARAMMDKWESALFSLAADLPFAPTALAADPAGLRDLVAAHGFPLIAKPRRGFGSNSVHIILEPHQLESFVGDGEMVVQKFFGDAGPVIALDQVAKAKGWPLFHSFETAKPSMQAFVARDGSCRGLFVGTNHMHWGMAARVERLDCEECRSVAASVAQAFGAAGWKGPLNLQAHRDPQGRLGIIEYAGRFTGATAGRVMLGYDEVRLALQELAAIDIPPLDPLAADAIDRRLVSRAATRHMVDSLRREGRWSPRAQD